MKSNPHEPPQVPLTEEQRREQILIAKAHMEAAQAAQASINKVMGEIELRKWCIEQANEFCMHNERKSQQYDDFGPFVLDEIARAILKFIGEPFTDLFEKKPAID